MIPAIGRMGGLARTVDVAEKHFRRHGAHYPAFSFVDSLGNSNPFLIAIRGIGRWVFLVQCMWETNETETTTLLQSSGESLASVVEGLGVRARKLHPERRLHSAVRNRQ